MAELLATLRTPSFIARCSTQTPMHIVAAKKIIKKAFRLQKEEKCFSLVEVLSTCPTNWGITPCDATRWIIDNMEPYYKLGVLKDPEKGEG